MKLEIRNEILNHNLMKLYVHREINETTEMTFQNRNQIRYLTHQLQIQKKILKKKFFWKKIFEKKKKFLKIFFFSKKNFQKKKKKKIKKIFKHQMKIWNQH